MWLGLVEELEWFDFLFICWFFCYSVFVDVLLKVGCCDDVRVVDVKY